MDDADIMLLTNTSMLNDVLNHLKYVSPGDKQPILFATDYHILKASKDVIGAFYWKKGRSQLLFVRKRLKAHGIILSNEYQQYIIDEL